MKAKELTPVIIEALQNDVQLKALYAELSKIHQMAIPIVIQVSEREFKASYSDEFNESIAKLHEEINFRQEQIISFYQQ